MPSFLSRIPRETKVATVVLAMALVQVAVLAGLGLDRAGRSAQDAVREREDSAGRAARSLAASSVERVAAQESEILRAVAQSERPLGDRLAEALSRAPLFTSAWTLDADGTMGAALRPPYSTVSPGRPDADARERLRRIEGLERRDSAAAAEQAAALAAEIESAEPESAPDRVAAALAHQSAARSALARRDDGQALRHSAIVLDRYRTLRDDRSALSDREPLGVSSSAVACEALLAALPLGGGAEHAAFADRLCDRRAQTQRMGALLSDAARAVEIAECRRLLRLAVNLRRPERERIDRWFDACDAIDRASARFGLVARSVLASAAVAGEPVRLPQGDGSLLLVVPVSGDGRMRAVAFGAEPSDLRARAVVPVAERAEPPAGVVLVVRDSSDVVLARTARAGGAADPVAGSLAVPPGRPVAGVALGRALPGLRVEAFLTDQSGAIAPGDPTRRYWVWVLAGAGLAVVAASLLAIRAVSRELRLARMKSDFVSNLSHELRTPLTSMKLFVETLQEGRVRDEKEAKECLDVVAQETDRLTSFVDRILTFSAFEKGRAVVDAKPCDPSEVARTAAEVFRRRAASAGARLSVDAPAGLPASHLDRDAIIQVLLNLFDNALKHGALPGGSPDNAVKKGGDKGGATIRLTVRALDAGGTEMIVEDDGPGVPGKERELVFEEFYRGDDTLSRRTQGTGIGLALCRRIVLAHGGSIDVSRSASLGGAAFRLRLPGGGA